MKRKKKPDWPDAYLHVREERSGEEWIQPIRGNEHLDLDKLVRKWIKRQFAGELRLDAPIMQRGAGLADYSAHIYTDGRPPGSTVCWESCGFWVKYAGPITSTTW